MDVDGFAQLHFDELQLGLGNHSMAAACGHGDDVARLHILLHAVHNGLALACDDRPHLVPVLMAVVVHLMACIQGHFDGHRRLVDVDDLKAAPRFLGEHDPVVERVDEGLDVAGLLLIRDQNALRAGRDYHILQTHAEDGHIQLVEWARQKNGVWVNKSISSLEFLEKMFRMMNWNRECRYKVLGRVANSDQGLVMLFDLEEAIMFTPQPQEFTDPMTGEVKKKQVKFFPDIYKGRIGRSYNDYVATHQMSMFENIVSYQGDEQAQTAIMAAKNEEVEGKKEAEDVEPTASAATETERIDHEINSSGPSSTQTINTEEGQNQYLYEKRGATT